jgi:hypothetical protein
MRKLGLILLLSLPLGCAPADSNAPSSSPSTPSDSNATSAAVQPENDATTTRVVIAVPGMQ